MKRLGFILFVALSLTWVACVRTDGFSVALIEAPLLKGSSLPLSLAGEKALSQPFHYLSKGRQCFVFESEDGKYVLKFFNQKYLKMPWYAFLPLVHEKEKAKRAKRRHFYLHSYELAFREFGEEILYLHLGPAQEKLPILQATDKAKRSFLMDLNQFPFVLQRKGIPLYTALSAVYEKEGMEGLCREIDFFVDAVASRIEKHIADSDRDVEHNWGVIDGHLFHLDPGRLHMDERLVCPIQQKTEWWSATHRFRDWLEELSPEAAVYLDQRILMRSSVGSR